MLQEKRRRLDELEQFRNKLKKDRLKLKENIQKKKDEIQTARKNTYQTLKKESKINEEIKKQHQSFSRDQVVQRKMSLKSTINDSRHQRVFSARFVRENIEKEYEIRMKIIDMLKISCEENDKALNSLLEITCPSQKSIEVSSQLFSVETSIQGKIDNPEPRPMSPEREVP
jgi:DNA-binding TFAR19-related protein (PDSD5 family)